MDKKRLLFNSQKTVLNNNVDNKLFMELDILLLKNSVNLNKYYFTESFIDEIVNNQDKYNGLPLVVDLEKLMSQDYFNLGHNYSPIVDKFYTEQIGSYVRFEKKFDANGIAELHGTARVSKRNTDLVDVLLNLYNSSIGLNFSVEVAASDYSVDNEGVLTIDASDNNFLMSDALVSFPAEPDSQALKLVAELNNSLRPKGGEKVEKKDILNDLSHDDIRSRLNELINPNKDDNGWRVYDYWIVSVFNDYVIIEDVNESGIYYKIQYSIDSNDEITLGDKTQVEIEFVAVNEGGKTVADHKIDVNELVKEKEKLVLDNEKLQEQVKEHETLVSEKAGIEVKLGEANETIVSLGKEKETLVAELEELRQYKKDIVEKEAKTQIETLINEVKEQLSEDEIKSLNELGEGLDVEKVKFKINELCAQKYKESLKLNNSVKDNFFPASPQKDLADDDLSKFNM